MFKDPVANLAYPIYIFEPKVLVPALVDEHNNPTLIHTLSTCGRLKSQGYANFHITKNSIDYLNLSYGSKDGKISVIKGLLREVSIQDNLHVVESIFLHANYLKPVGFDIVIVTDRTEIKERAKLEKLGTIGVEEFQEKVKEIQKHCDYNNPNY